MATYVYAAFFGNLIVAISKFIAGSITHSSAMISEGLHSLADTINQLLLAFGLHRSKKEADSEFQFGYAKVQFFWALIVSILIFGLAGTLSVVQGYERLISGGQHSEDFLINYIVLFFAIIIEGFALFMAYRETKIIQHEKGYKTLIETIENLRNPALLTILAEDSLAIMGLFLAIIATLLTDITGDIIWDGIGSLVIGLLLMSGALILARENRDYLIGKAMSKKEEQIVVDIINASPNVKSLTAMRSMVLGPSDTIIALDVDFVDDLDTEDLENAIDDIEQQISEAFPLIKKEKIFIEPN